MAGEQLDQTVSYILDHWHRIIDYELYEIPDTYDVNEEREELEKMKMVVEEMSKKDYQKVDFDVTKCPTHKIVDIGAKFAKTTNILDRVFSFDLKRYFKFYRKEDGPDRRTEEEKESDATN